MGTEYSDAKAHLEILLTYHGSILFKGYISLYKRNLNQLMWVNEACGKLLSGEPEEILNCRMELYISRNQAKIRDRLIKKQDKEIEEINRRKDRQIAAERGARLRLEKEISRLEKELYENAQVEEAGEEFKNDGQIREQNEQEGCSNFKQTSQYQDSGTLNPNQFFASPTHRNNSDDNITTQQPNNWFVPSPSEDEAVKNKSY